MSGAIDILCNLFTPEAIQKNWFEQPEIHRLITWWKMEDRVKGIAPDDFVRSMDAAGVDKVLLPAIRMMSYQKKTMVWDIQEDEIAALMARHPGRFVGIAGFNPMTKSVGVRQVEHAVRTMGFKGVYVHTYGYGIPLNHRQYYPLYAKCE